MARAAGWVLGTLTSAWVVVGCDSPGASHPPPPLVKRTLPETADLRADSSPGPDRPAAPVTVAPVKALPPGAPAASAQPAPPSPRTESVAALLLMLPVATDDPAGARGPRTYKLSLGADLAAARVEIDGRDIGTMPVRRVYPEPRVVGAARPTMPAPFGVPRVRPARRAVTAVDETLPTTQARILNANSAPIID